MPNKCRFCGAHMVLAGLALSGSGDNIKKKQLYQCAKCRRRTVSPVAELPAGLLAKSPTTREEGVGK